MKKNLVLGLFLLLFAIGIKADAAYIAPKDDEIYKINNVKIENVSDDLVAGKQKAIDDGKKAAFESLMKRFVSYGYIEKAPSFTFEQIDDAIKNVGVVEELVTDTKYEARMNYEFAPAKVLKLLDLKSIGILPKKENYLLIPVLTQKGQVLPWQQVWMDAWKQSKVASLTLPLGDLEDMKALTTADLSKLNYSGLDVLARRYKIPVIILADASFDVPKNLLTVTLKRFETSPKKVAEYKYPGSFGIGSSELFMTAAKDLLATIQANGIPSEGEELDNPLAAQDVEIQYARDYQSDEKNGQTLLKASVLTRSLSDWSALRRKLINCKLINNISVNSFTATETDVNIYYVGTVDELGRSLATNGLTITKQSEKYIIDRVE